MATNKDMSKEYKKVKFLGIDLPGEATYEDALEYVNSQAGDNAFWNSLTPEQQLRYLEQYADKDAGGFWSGVSNLVFSPLSLLGVQTTNEKLDVNNLLADLAALSDIEKFDTAEPLISDYVQSSKDLYSDIDREMAGRYATAQSRLDSQADIARQDFENQLDLSNNMFNRQVSNLMSNQYAANAQTFDTLQSDLRKSRQNALEAGASAGLRIAGNVNALLSAQNKQSQTSMDTSNALAEMLLQQRNAAAGLRTDYHNYMSDINRQKTDLDMQKATERENLYNQRHSAQVNDYDTALGTYTAKENAWSSQFDDTNKFSSAYRQHLRNSN